MLKSLRERYVKINRSTLYFFRGSQRAGLNGYNLPMLLGEQNTGENVISTAEILVEQPALNSTWPVMRVRGCRCWLVVVKYRERLVPCC